MRSAPARSTGPARREYLDDQDFRERRISIRHAQHAGALPGPHRDPFDRMLVSQALLEGLTLVSNETLFDPYESEIACQLTCRRAMDRLAGAFVLSIWGAFAEKALHRAYLPT